MSRVALGYAVALAVAAAFGALSSAALRPGSWFGWLGLAALVLALGAVGEWAWDKALSFNAQPARRFSLLRIAILLVLMVPLYGVTMWVSWLTGGAFR